jgi:exodeoxyribonuclease-5
MSITSKQAIPSNQLITLTPKQEEARKKAVDNFHAGSLRKPVFFLGGFAGCGKTTLISFILDSIDIELDKIAFVTYTGMAACVLLRKGFSAATIHRTIYVPCEVKENGKTKIIFKLKDSLDGIELIILDELSQVSNALMEDIESFKIPVLALGDPFQCQPVSGGKNKYIDHPDVLLDEPVRQALDSPIIYIANMLRQKIKPKIGLYEDNGKVEIFSNNSFPLDCMGEANQILAGKNKTCQNINKIFRHTFLKKKSKYPSNGEKIICLKNDWSKMISENGIDIYLVNGLAGIVDDIQFFEKTKTYSFSFKPTFFLDTNFKKIVGDTLLYDDIRYKDTNEIKLDFPDIYMRRFGAFNNGNIVTNVNQFDYGYCITVYKSQGSEFDNVLYFDECLSRDTYFNHYYTAVTRAKKNLTIVG